MLRRASAKDLSSRLLKPPKPTQYAVAKLGRGSLTTFNIQRFPVSVRYYSQPPGGPKGGGFPGFSLQPQHQKGEALKEYVRTRLLLSTWMGIDWNRVLI
jgi:hypothetical protein